MTASTTKSSETPSAAEPPVRSLAVGGPRLGPRRLGLLVALPIVGAVTGAALGLTPAERHVGEAVVAVQADNGSDAAALHRDQWRTAASAAEMPSVLLAAARDVGPVRPELDSLRARVSTAGSAGSSVLRIQARANSPASARTLAGAVAQETVRFLRDVNRSSISGNDRVQAYSFELGANGWSAANSTFSSAPRVLAREPLAEVGRFSLRVECGAAVGCGAHVQARRTFTASFRYRAAAYMRATRPGTRVRLVFGSSPRDVAVGPTVTLPTTRWQLLSVRWTPHTSSATAEFSSQTRSPQRSTTFLDGATLGEDLRGVDQSDQLTLDGTSRSIRLRRAAAGDRYSVVGAASSVGELSSDTLRWTLVGGLVGLAMAVAGLAGVELARRRQRSQSQPHAEVDAVAGEL